MSNFDGTAAGLKNIQQLWGCLTALLKDLVGDVDLTKGTLQDQMESHTHDLVFSDVSVEPDSFVADETYVNYPFKVNITCAGATCDHVPIVTLGIEEASGGSFAPVCESGENRVTLYASEVPEKSILIPSIICVRGGN